jgi:hypothetical protein
LPGEGGGEGGAHWDDKLSLTALVADRVGRGKRERRLEREGQVLFDRNGSRFSSREAKGMEGEKWWRESVGGDGNHPGEKVREEMPSMISSGPGWGGDAQIGALGGWPTVGGRR